MQGVQALDFSERMGLGSLQAVSIHTEKYVELPDWFVRAHGLFGDVCACLDPSWLLPGEIREESYNFELANDISKERAAQLVAAFLYSEQLRRIEDLEGGMRVAISELEATRDQFQSSAIADIRRMLEDVLEPRMHDDEN
ncbi:hypothetical protein HY311_00080 [Candidatus Nomurabacteria bacterium]|nr:hypothetical protein [Candidatus Nomurabacteria bacterium]